MGVLGLQENQKEISLPLTYKQTNNISNLRQYGAMPNFLILSYKRTKRKRGNEPLIDLFVNKKITLATSGNIDQCQKFKAVLQKKQKEILCFSIVKFVNRQIT